MHPEKRPGCSNILMILSTRWLNGPEDRNASKGYWRTLLSLQRGFAALGKYLTSFDDFFRGICWPNDPRRREPSVRRNAHAPSYLVNDILYHSKYRINDASICGKVTSILVGLFGSAASFKGMSEASAESPGTGRHMGPAGILFQRLHRQTS